MDENRESILNGYCFLEIMNYVIANCKAKPKSDEDDLVDYDDLINFVLADEFFFGLLEDHHKRFYEELEFELVCKITKLMVDLRINKNSNKGNGSFWRSYLQLITERSHFSVELSFDKAYVNIYIKGNSPGCKKTEKLKVNFIVTVDALADILRSNRLLSKLDLKSTKVHGNLSNIIPHCANLEELRISLDAKQDAAQFAPLAKMPNLKKLTITGLFKTPVETTYFKNFIKWQRPNCLRPLTLTLEYYTDFYGSDFDLDLNVDIITIAMIPSLRKLTIIDYDFIAVYDIDETTKDCNLVEESLANFTLGERVNVEFDRNKGELEIRIFEGADTCEIRIFSQLPNLQRGIFNTEKDINSETTIMAFSLLTAFDVEAAIIGFGFRITFSKKEKHLQIIIYEGNNIDIPQYLVQIDGVNTLQILGHPNTGTLNTVFEALASNLNSIQELELPESKKISFEEISKVCEIQSIRKLKCSVADTDGIQKLANLSKLEDLEIYITEKGSLCELLTKLAEKNIIQCIRCEKLSPEEVLKVTQIRSLKKLVYRLSYMEEPQSLSELAKSSIVDLTFLHRKQIFYHSPDTKVKVLYSDIPLQQLSFAKTVDVTKIKSLKGLRAGFSDSECVEILDRLPHLETLTIGYISNTFDKTCLQFPLRILALKTPATLKTLDLNNVIGYSECKYLTEIETLESFKCSLRNEPGLQVLVNIKNLKELIIKEHLGSLSKLFGAFALKTESKLQELHTHINCSEEIREISQIKSLTTLNIFYESKCDNLSDLARLHELTSLSIVDKFNSEIDSDSVLPVFQSCQKLESVSLDFQRGVSLNFVKEVNDILRTIRDPTLQKPLKLTIFNGSVCPEIPVEDFEKENLNVFFLYEKYHYTEIESEEEVSSCSETGDDLGWW